LVTERWTGLACVTNATLREKGRDRMLGQCGRVVCLHEHRELADHPERELEQLLRRLLEEKYDHKLLALANAYAEEKAAQTVFQMVGKGRVDRDELYDALIAWALLELREIDEAGEAVA